MTPAGALLSWARAVLDHPEVGLVGTWPRAAALLGRQSLEEGLDQFWERQLPQMRQASRATQLACLEQYLKNPGVVWGIRTAWGTLSQACHHHAYELAPTAAELEQWLAAVERLVSRLSDAEAVA